MYDMYDVDDVVLLDRKGSSVLRHVGHEKCTSLNNKSGILEYDLSGMYNYDRCKMYRGPSPNMTIML